MTRRRGRIPSSSGRLIAASVVALAMAGCATTPPAKQAAVKSLPLPTSRPIVSREALLSLEQIQPAEKLPASRPTTAPAEPASLEALQLFAQARAAMQSGQRFTAVQLLSQALTIDPDSFELNMAMGEAAAGTALASRAIPALEHAAKLDPDSIDVYLQMARLHLVAADGKEAIRDLRRAQQTSAYRGGDPSSLAVDFFLARTLQVMGYDSAALRQFDRVLDRMPRVAASYRGPIEVMQILRNPDLVFIEVARLAGRLGDYQTALAAIEQAMVESPDTTQYAILRVQLLQQAGRGGEARKFLPEVISRFGAGTETMSLLREVYASAGGDPAAIADLRRALTADSDDQNIAYALADLLVRAGKADEARSVLTGVVRQLDYQTAPAKRLLAMLESQGRTSEAARLLVEASARHPDQLSEYAGPMAQLTRIWRSNHLRLRDLQAMQVESWAEPARLYWVARVAANWDRDELARASLEKAVRGGKPFVPAYRALLQHYFDRHDWDTTRKVQTAQGLVTLAQMNEDEGLAAELRGLIALETKKPAEASQQLLEAMRLGDSAPEVQYAYAKVQQQRGNITEAERVLLKVNEEYPAFEPAYVRLFSFYMDRKLTNSALRTIQRWLAADPRSATARIYQAVVLEASGRSDLAERILLDLFDEYSDNAEVLAALQGLYMQSGRLEQFTRLLEQKRQDRPQNREVAAQLVQIYDAQRRIAEADRVIADLRRTAAGDSDLLYYVSHLYGIINDQKSAESVLNEALKVDPQHSSAANDLGYFLAQQGRDLDRAEALVRIAVQQEPDNQAFLDSLGWVMYKRGRIEPAREYLEKAIAQTINPDPVVLDHLGDAYYRLGRQDDAVARWREAAKVLENPAMTQGEYATTRASLLQKLRAADQGLPVTPSPLARGSVANAAPAPATKPATTRPDAGAANEQ